MRLPVHFLIPLAAALAACDGGTVRDTIGLSRKAPDEFRVVSRPPLSVPPEFNLRPPAGPGEAAEGAGQPAYRQAQSLVLGSDGDIRPGSAETAVLPVSSGALESAADAQFLKNAGADRADAGIRETLQREAAARAPEEKTLLQKLREPRGDEPVVNAEGEAERIRQNKAAQKPVTEGETPMNQPKDTGTLGRIFGY